MGLAASQARFLLLSSRQSDVELRMQSITNQKLALQRQSGDIASKYQRALNSTNLSWNDGQINYGTITDPTGASQYMITDSYGAVVLDSSLSGLLKDPKLPASGSGADFEALYPDQETFLLAISGSTIKKEEANVAIEENKKAQEEAKKRLDNNDNTPGKVTVNYNDADILKNAGPQVMGFYNANEAIELLPTLITKDVDVHGNTFDSNSKTVEITLDDMKAHHQDVASAYGTFQTFFDGLSQNLENSYYTTLCYGKDGGGGPLANSAALVQKACDYAYSSTLNQFLYGYYDTDANSTETISDMTYQEEIAKNLDASGNSLYELRQPNAYGGDKTHSDLTKENKSLNTIDFIMTPDTASAGGGLGDIFGKDDSATATASLKVYPQEVIKTYMNYFDMYMAAHGGKASEDLEIGTNMKAIYRDEKRFTESEKKSKSESLETHYSGVYSGATVTEEVYDSTNNTTVVHTRSMTVDESNAAVSAAVNSDLAAWVTKNTDFNVFAGYTSERKEFGGTDPVSAYGSTTESAATAKAQYYMKLYNALCSSGWVTDAKANDSKYLENQLMYGNYVVGRMGSYTAYSELSVTDSYTPFTLEDDKEAQERAEIEYEAARDSLAYKEALLDAQLDDLTTEREAITTEKESVQALIDENVKKFKLFA